MISTLLHSVYFFVACNLHQPAVSQNSLPNSNQVAVEVNKGQLKLNKKTADKDWSLDFFYKILGQPSADDEPTDGKECYNTKGIVMWKNLDKVNTVDQFLVQFADDPDESWYSSATYFSGTVVVDKVKITSKTKPAELKSKLPNYKWEKNSLDWYEGRYMNVFMYVGYDSTEQNILWIDFGTY